MTQGQKTLVAFIINHPNNDKLLGIEETHEIAKANNRATEQKIISSIKQLPKLEVKATTMHDWAFTEPICELNKKQNDIFKKLLDDNN